MGLTLAGLEFGQVSDTKQEWNKGAILRAKGGVHPTGPECVTLALVIAADNLRDSGCVFP